MKKIFLAIIMMATYQLANAQMGEKVTFGLRGGISLGGFTSSDIPKMLNTKSSKADWSINSSNNMSYTGGIVVDIPVCRAYNLSIQTGLWWTEKNARFEAETGLYTNGKDYGQKGGYWTGNKKAEEIKAMYIQLPILATYHYNFGPFRTEVNAGPYLEYRINKGDFTYEQGTYRSGFYNGKDVSKPYNPDKTEGDAFNDDCKKFSYGLQVGAGIYWKKLYLGAQYQLGISDYFSGLDTEVSLKASQLNAIVGVQF